MLLPTKGFYMQEPINTYGLLVYEITVTLLLCVRECVRECIAVITLLLPYRSPIQKKLLLWTLMCFSILWFYWLKMIIISSTFQTQLTKPSQVFVRPTGIQTVPSLVSSTIIICICIVVQLWSFAGQFYC